MYAETAVDACAGETDEDAEFGGGPLGGGGEAVAAAVVGGGFLDLEELVDAVSIEAGGKWRMCILWSESPDLPPTLLC